MRLPIATYKHRSSIASPSRLCNCYVEQLPKDSPYPYILSRSEGVTSAAEVGASTIRGLFYSQTLGYLFVVSGSELYKVDSANAATLVGTIGNTSITSIDIEENTEGIVVVNTPNAYTYDGTTLAPISDTDFTSRGATDVEFLDNWLLFLEPNSGRVFGADLGELSLFDSLNFFTAEGSPDNAVGMKVDHRQLVIFGNTTTEIWENVGSGSFPFARSINGLIELGCLAGRSIEKLDNTIFWLASDFTVRRLDGSTPRRISTHAIEQWLQGVTVSSCRAYTISREGHFFYVLTFDEGTRVYDAVTDEWAERETYGYDYWQFRTYARAFNRDYVGSSISNEIGTLSKTVYDELEGSQVMSWTYQPVYADAQRAFHDRFEVILETGVGLSTGQGSDPQIMLEKSDDGGRTWTFLPDKSMGAMGQYKSRVIWHRLGSARQRVYRCSVSDPVPVNVVDTILSVRGGRL